MSCNHCCSCNDNRLQVGDILYGFCNGYFGRDSYGDKTVEAIGRDWVVVREDNNAIQLYVGSPNFLVQYKTETEQY